MKIYTKTGDSGTTGLFAGPRVPKDHPRIQAYGTVDELNAHLGAAVTALSELAQPGSGSGAAVTAADTSPGPSETTGTDWPERLIGLLVEIQSDLFSIGAQLATPDPVAHGMCLLSESRITDLELAIDEFEGQLEPLSHFILPGGCRPASLLHICRTVCRRAEREIVHLAHEPDVAHCDQVIIFLNRLSDLLFSASRYANFQAGVPERAWERPKSGD